MQGTSILAAREAKDINEVGDLTLIVADVSEKAIRQVKSGMVELLHDRVGEEKAVTMAEKMATGTWTHDYGITASEAEELGFPVRVGMPNEIMKLMTLYPQPVQMTSSVYLPIQTKPVAKSKSSEEVPDEMPDEIDVPVYLGPAEGDAGSDRACNVAPEVPTHQARDQGPLYAAELVASSV